MSETRKPKYETLVLDKLESLKIGESFVKKEFIQEHWNDYDYFIDRSFSVFFSMAKKKMPEKKFKTIENFIIRIE